MLEQTQIRVAMSETGSNTIVSGLANGIDVQSTAAKKKSKKKNKSKLTSKTDVDHSNCDSHADSQLNDGVDEHEIQLVSDELLKRLQLNGGTAGKGMDTVRCEQGKCATNGKSTAVQKSVKEPNNANKPANHHLHNIHNNNNCKEINCLAANTSVAEDILCNGVSHTSDGSQSNVIKSSPECKTTVPATANDTVPSEKCTRNDSCLSAAVAVSGTGVTSAETPLSVPQLPKDSPKICGTGAGDATVDNSKPAITITYKEYENELQMPDIMRVIQRELSEPYSIYTYRYFIHNWPKLCFLAMAGDYCVGAIVCKLDIHRQVVKRGYIAMLAVDQDYRKLKVGTTLVQKAIEVR